MTSTSIDICYVISHGFAARMIVQSGLIEQLTQEGLRIAIIAPDDQDPNLIDLADKNKYVEIYNANIDQSIWDDDYSFKRKYFLEDMDKNPVFWEKHYHSIWYSKSLHPWKRIRPLWYGFIYYLVKIIPSIRERFIKHEYRYLKDLHASELVQKINPKLVVSSYPVNYLESKILFAAKDQGRSTLIQLLSWDNITSKGIFPVIPDYFMAWGKIMFDELIQYYKVGPDRIKICGVPHFDNHIKILKTPDKNIVLSDLGLDPDKPYLFFAMSSPRFAPKEIDIVEHLSGQITDNAYGKDMQLVIRPHPQNVQGSLADIRWISRLDALMGKRCAVDYPKLEQSNIRWSMKRADLDQLSLLLADCSLCINSGSTVSIDALVMGKPVLLTSFDGGDKLHYWKSARRLIDYIHLKKLVDLGGAEPVFSYEELKLAILRYLDNPAYKKEQREFALQQECHSIDGHATRKSVEAIKYFLKYKNIART